jgi:hypothetical protein
VENVKRCARCILPGSYPGIVFDEAGVCNFCAAHERWTPRGLEKLEEALAPYRGAHPRYDCIAAVSGGRDSSYMLWYAVRKLGLRTLAVSVDNGYVPEQTKVNIERAVKILGVDLVVKKHGHVRSCFPHTMRAWIRRPSPGMIGLLCGGCNYALRYHLLETAREHDVPLMLFGVGEPEPPTTFAERLLMSDPNREMSKPRLAAGFALKIAQNPAYVANPRVVATYGKEFAYRWSKRLRNLLTRRIAYPEYKILEPFYYIGWNEEEISSTIARELDWKKASYAGAAWRSDCTIATLKNYLYGRTLGFSKVDELLSNMVRTGMLTRDAALERLGRDSVISEDFIREFLAGEGVSYEALDRSLARSGTPST